MYFGKLKLMYFRYEVRHLLEFSHSSLSPPIKKLITTFMDTMRYNLKIIIIANFGLEKMSQNW